MPKKAKKFSPSKQLAKNKRALASRKKALANKRPRMKMMAALQSQVDRCKMRLDEIEKRLDAFAPILTPAQAEHADDTQAVIDRAKEAKEAEELRLASNA